MTHSLPFASLLLALAACSQSEPEPGSPSADTASAVPGDSEDKAAWSGIAPDETVKFTGTEPFWGGESAGDMLTYSTPEDPDGTAIAIGRFAGRNGLSLSGELDGQPFVMAVTPGDCSDGMSDRGYPFTVTLQVRGEQRNGCAWTDRQGFTGPENP